MTELWVHWVCFRVYWVEPILGSSAFWSHLGFFFFGLAIASFIWHLIWRSYYRRFKAEIDRLDRRA